MGWISPTSFTDFSGDWINETNAYDGNLATYTRGKTGSNAYLILSVAGYITCYKIRIYCSTVLGGDLDEIEIFTIIDGNIEWIHYQGPVPALTWFEISFNSLISMKNLYIRKQTAGWWWVYEVEFWSGSDGYEPPAVEDYIVANENVIINALSVPLQRNLVVGPDGRIHCVFRRCLSNGRISHVYYAYSDDYGKTWTIEDPASSLTDKAQYFPSIAVDSNSNPHIVFKDEPSTIHGLIHTGRYARRSANGTWTLSDFYVGSYVTEGGGPTPPPFNFAVGDEVEGSTSEVRKTIAFVYIINANSKILCFEGGSAGLIEGEMIFNLDQAGNQCWLEYDVGPSAETSIVIDLNNRLRIVGSWATHLWYWVQLSQNAMILHSQGIIGPGSLITIDIDPSNSIRTVYKDGLSYHDGYDDTLICTGTSAVTGYFSIASDSNGDIHFVVAETGLGGTYSTKLNIKYYKRTSGTWSGPTHITDVDYVQRYPSISIDNQHRIHVMWQGAGWGTYTGQYSALMRTYENGEWGATQVILNASKDQGAYGPSLLHAWHPNSNRLKDPVYIFNRQGSWKIQFGGNLYIVAPPDTLLTEQTKNPTDVGDPKPEFSAIHRVKLA